MNMAAVSQPTEISGFNPIAPIAAAKPRLLIVSDSVDRLAALRALLQQSEIEILDATSFEEVRQASLGKYDLAVIDVSPAHLVGVLKTLRSSAGHSEVPVLVEASRLSHDSQLAGVLPKYRAMPCHQLDLIGLARRRILSSPHRRREKKIL